VAEGWQTNGGPRSAANPPHGGAPIVPADGSRHAVATCA
jgi:hypothetical protein